MDCDTTRLGGFFFLVEVIPDMEPIQLYASIPPIQSAIKVGGDGSGRIQFDVPTTEMAQLLRLVAFAPGKLLRLTIEVQDDAGET
jgi:hypothetical protein